MYVVADYADKNGPDFVVAEVKTANYEQRGLLYMGTYKPLMEKRGFPEVNGRNALDLLYEKIIMAGKKVDYVCLGQMTTLGCLIFIHPDVAGRLNRVLICPGEQNKNRDYPVSEEHILSDPVASRIVMDADMVKVIMAEETLSAQYKRMECCLSGQAVLDKEPSVFVTVNLDKGCTYGSLYIDRLNICKKKPNSVLIGGYYDGKDSCNN